MSLYVASIHSPGFLPILPPRMFRTPRDAWAYLAGERRRAQENAGEHRGDTSDTLHRLEILAIDGGSGDESVYGTAPGHRPGAGYSGLLYEVQTV